MRVGIFAKTFPGTDPRTVLRAARAAGYDCVQYNMACSGLPSLPEAVPQDVITDLRAAMAETGVAISALSGTWNMIHPDSMVRAQGMASLAVLLPAAKAMGAGMVTLCTGTRDSQDQWRGHPDNDTPEAWADLLAEMAKACALAEAEGLTLGVEPELANVVNSAEAAARLLDALQSPALRIVLDPANLVEVAPPDQRRDVITRAVERLSGRIGMAHAKDRDASGHVVAAGQGEVDFPSFVSALRAVGFAGDLVTHGLSAEEASGVARFLRGLA